jgi:hypothetical protein
MGIGRRLSSGGFGSGWRISSDCSFYSRGFGLGSGSSF